MDPFKKFPAPKGDGYDHQRFHFAIAEDTYDYFLSEQIRDHIVEYGAYGLVPLVLTQILPRLPETLSNLCNFDLSNSYLAIPIVGASFLGLLNKVYQNNKTALPEPFFNDSDIGSGGIF
jgi:hypothetical protein